MEQRLGFIGIILENRASSVDEVNHIISEFNEYIISRMGVPYREKDVSVITLVVDMDTDTLGRLTGRLGNLPDVSVKSGLVKGKKDAS